MERHCNISTHSLTRRLTDLILLANGQSYISTHSLTRRLTVCLISNSSQQENFNSQPHKEADGLLPFICRLDSISTHSLTRRLTVLNNIVPTSQSYFNSQPHKEADKMIVMSMDG